MRIFELTIALVVGFVVGCALSAYFAFKWADTYMTDNSYVGISDRYEVLQALRAGETNKAIDALEMQMTVRFYCLLQ
jgi:myo-inositol catabolism protein IolC